MTYPCLALPLQFPWASQKCPQKTLLIKRNVRIISFWYFTNCQIKLSFITLYESTIREIILCCESVNPSIQYSTKFSDFRWEIVVAATTRRRMVDSVKGSHCWSCPLHQSHRGLKLWTFTHVGTWCLLLVPLGCHQCHIGKEGLGEQIIINLTLPIP